jgi:sugar/nucleoside kinase (ribokinase family)
MNDRETLSVELNVLAEDLPPIPVGYTDSRYIFLANTHPGGQLALRGQFPDAKLIVADTMDLWIETERNTLLELLKSLDGLVLNDSESLLLTGERNPVTAGRRILDMGPKFVVIKQGEHGALLVHQDGLANLPAFPTDKVVDPTGAGDTFGGGMMGHLAASDDVSFGNLRHAMAVGTVTASFTLETFSLDRLMTLSQHDIQGRLNQYTEMLSF